MLPLQRILHDRFDICLSKYSQAEIVQFKFSFSLDQIEFQYLYGGLSTLCFKSNELKRSKLFSQEFDIDLVLLSIKKTSFMIDKKVPVLNGSKACALQNLMKRYMLI